MDQSDLWLAANEEWRRKSNEHYIVSNDELFSVMTRGFETMSFLQSPDFDRNRIRRSLLKLESDRNVSMQCENSNADPIRLVTYGFMESYHHTILLLMEKIDSLELERDNSRIVQKSTVEQDTQTEIDFIDFLNSFKIEEEEEINEENSSGIDQIGHSNADSMDALSTIPMFTNKSKSIPILPKKEPMEVKEEPIDPINTRDIQISGLNGDEIPLTPNEEEIPNDDAIDRMDDTVAGDISFNDQPSNDDIENEQSHDMHQADSMDDPMNEFVGEEGGDAAEGGLMDEQGEENVDAQKESSGTVEVEKKKRPSRISTKSVKYNESMDESDGEEEPLEKKSKTEKADDSSGAAKKKEGPSGSASKPKKCDESMEDSDGEEELTVKKTRSDSANNGNKATPQCVICQVYLTSIYSYASHFQKRHNGLRSNGFYLICSCGEEVRSNRRHPAHVECAGIEFKLQKLGEKKYTTPQCVLCEVYPTSIYRYADHLQRHHKVTLKSNGLFLICSCGKEVRTPHHLPDHDEKCNGLEFTLHNLNEMKHTTPQCTLCEAYPTTACGYAAHLYSQHDSTLKAEKLYLLCSCGKKIGSHKTDSDHPNKCDGKQFTLHNLDDK